MVDNGIRVDFPRTETMKPSQTGPQIHALSLVHGEKVAAMFSLVMFCGTMISAANKWYEDHKGDPNVQAGMSDLIRWCPDGLMPFIDGAPVVASGK
jgi:hypothetical protein